VKLNLKREHPDNILIDQALSRIELSEPPAGFTAAVMDQVELASRSLSQEINWRAVALAALLASGVLAYALLSLYNRLGQFASPENFLRLQFEVWFWIQSARLSWLTLLLKLPDLSRMLRGAPFLAAGVVFSTVGLMLCIGIGLAIKKLPQPGRAAG